MPIKKLEFKRVAIRSSIEEWMGKSSKCYRIK